MEQRNKIRIIIADNDKLYVEAFQVLTSSYSFCEVIEECFSYHQLIISEKLKQCDVLFININLPELDGLSYGSFIKAKYPGIKVYALTLNKDFIIQEETLNAGFDGLIYKPNSAPEFDQFIQAK